MAFVTLSSQFEGIQEDGTKTMWGRDKKVYGMGIGRFCRQRRSSIYYKIPKP